MADPLSADRFLAALRAEGCKVVEHPGWRSHTRTSSGRPWGPVNGVMIHHTVTRGTDATVRICRDGYAGLPGPLCHGVIAKDGTIHLIGYGRTNHAGGGDPDVLEAVTDESYGTRPPVPNVGNSDGTDGNARFYGFECENLGDGVDPWPAVQLEAIERAAAAVCRAHGWGAKSVIGHLEWSDDKSDPRGVGMPSMRERVGARLGKTPSTPTPAPTPPKEDPVALSKTDVALAVLGYRNQKADEASKKAGRRIPDVYGYIVGTYQAVTGIAADVRKILALLSEKKES
ncbi:peptidoglycan recognition protein family protein [Streptomyces cinereoruber]|uniref:peptidoglycan recognition protein family protein n=1 Tax=Streptomyces cinereoruber TaxID=67260 RepID=UPI00363CA8B2